MIMTTTDDEKTSRDRQQEMPIVCVRMYIWKKGKSRGQGHERTCGNQETRKKCKIVRELGTLENRRNKKTLLNETLERTHWDIEQEMKGYCRLVDIGDQGTLETEETLGWSEHQRLGDTGDWGQEMKECCRPMGS